MLKTFKNNTAYDYGSSCSFFLGEIIVLLVCQGLAGVIAAGVRIAGYDLLSSSDFSTAFMIVIQLAVVGYTLVFSKVRKRKFNFVYVIDENGKKPRAVDFVVPVVAAVIILIGMYLPSTWYGYLTQVVGMPPEAGDISLTTVSSVVMMILATIVCAPIVEETVFRGVLFHGLKSKKSLVSSALLSALAFMIMHMNPLQVVYQFALGVLAAFIVYRSGRLISSIILHSASNALALVISMTPLSASLAGCEQWLTQNIAAAVFITLGLFVGGGLALFLLVRFCYDFKGTVAMFKNLFAGKKKAEKSEPAYDAPAPETPDAPETSDGGDTAEPAREAVPAFCPHCGKELQGRFCGSCGYDTEIEKQQAERKAVLAKYADRNAAVKYWIGVGICALMWIITLVTTLITAYLPAP